MDDLVSVIIPVYNAQDTIGSCLEAVVNCGYKNLEIICVDDGSADDSVARIERYCAQYGFIRLIREKHGGPAHARNAGVERSKGAFLFFVDSDIFIAPRAIQKLADCFRSDPALACAGGMVLPFSRVSRAEKFDDLRYRRIFGRKSKYVDYLPISNLLVSREMFLRIGGFDERFPFACEDCDFGRRLRQDGRKLLHCAQATALHVHSRNWRELLRRAFSYGQGWIYLTAKSGRTVPLQICGTVVNLVLLVPLTVVWPVSLWDLVFLYHAGYLGGKIKGIRISLAGGKT